TTTATSPSSTVVTGTSTSTTLPIACVPAGPACDDGDRCTVDTCDAATRTCLFAPVEGFEGIACVCAEVPEPCASVPEAARVLRPAARACAVAARAQASPAAGAQSRLLRRAARGFANALRRATRAATAVPCLSRVTGWLSWAHDECGRLASGG